MKVILLQDIKALGKKGELAEVSEGYGRNYLLPKKLAKEANAQAMNEYRNAENSKNFKIASAKAEAEKSKQALEGKILRMKANGNNGRLFGSVTSKQIAEEIRKQYGINALHGHFRDDRRAGRRSVSMADSGFSTDFGTLPYDARAEQAVLGAALIRSSVFDEVLDFIKSPDYFYQSIHKRIFEEMLLMVNSGVPIDPVLLIDRLRGDSDYENSGGQEYIINLADACPAPSNAKYYAQIVSDKYKLRRLITASRAIIDDATEQAENTSLILDAAEQRLFDIRSEGEVKGLERISSVILQTFDRLDDLNSEADSNTRAIPTGIGDLDRMITGLNRSDLIILAARPGMGKTSFALNIARNVACQAKKTVAFFSLEMSKEQLASRLLSSEAMVGGTKLRTGKLTDEEWQRLIPASDVLKNADMYLDDTSTITITEMKARLRRLKQVDLVVIDYLQLMASGRRIDNRVQEISAITRNLKIMAKELNVPIITLSQLSRASEQRTGDHRPQLSDLRDSGSIEQDADIVLFLFREGYYDRENGEENAPQADVNAGECIVAKNRHGETSTVKLHWQGEFMRFTGVERSRDQ